jgi:hypothetical protein
LPRAMKFLKPFTCMTPCVVELPTGDTCRPGAECRNN